MPKVAKAIQAEVGAGNRLTAVVATHRHADHISGFATDGRTGKSGDLIRALRPRLVLQPWTEDPKAQPDAVTARTASGGKKGLVARLANMNTLAERVQQLAKSKPAWMSAAARRELAFLGEDNLANKSAVNNLIAMGKGGAGQVPEVWRPNRTRKVAARRESTGARSAGSHPDRRHSEAAIQGPGSVLALRQRRRAGLPAAAKTARGRSAASRFPKKRAGSAIACSV